MRDANPDSVIQAIKAIQSRVRILGNDNKAFTATTNAHIECLMESVTCSASQLRQIIKKLTVSIHCWRLESANLDLYSPLIESASIARKHLIDCMFLKFKQEIGIGYNKRVNDYALKMKVDLEQMDIPQLRLLSQGLSTSISIHEEGRARLEETGANSSGEDEGTEDEFKVSLQQRRRDRKLRFYDELSVMEKAMKEKINTAISQREAWTPL